jgi:alkanesulfonate monooxygenase SsuD/methylene tetrahydromethanopterin reductase-like flavin-dependent oxidoreductase (luciferase family)
MPKWPDLTPEPTVDQLKKAVEAGQVVIGDPDDCAKAIRKWEEIGADQLCFSPTTNNLPTEVVVESMELFGKEVIPQFDTDPVHSTTRQREAAAAALGL